VSARDAASALTYLWLSTARNRLLAQRAQLKQPRYLIALLLGGLYVWWIFRINGKGQDAPFAAFDSTGIGPTVVAAVLLLLTARWWLSKPDKSALAFSPAEVHLLFPAPVSRRTLVQSKLARGQIAILLNVLIWVVLLRGSGASIEGWQRGFALWILFSTFTLHRLGAALVRLNAMQHRSAGFKRSALPTLVFATMFGTIAVVLWQARPEIMTAWALGPAAAFEVVHNALGQPVAAVVLAPVQALVAPVFARSSTAWLLAIGPSLLVLALHFVWVVRTDAAFEEAALEASQERAKVLAAMRGTQLNTKRSKRGGVARILPLPSWGHPAVTIAWKNIAAAIRGGGWVKQNVIIFVFFTAALAVFQITLGVDVEAVIAMTSIWGFMLLLIGPLWTRYDLRLDLRDLGTIRTLPLSGRSIVTAEILGVVFLHSISILVFLLVPTLMALLTAGSRATAVELLGAPWAIALAVPLVIVCVNLLTFTVQNGLALLYPAWVQLGTDRRGFEVMGQTMLTFGMTLVVGAVAFVFPTLLAAATWYIGRVWMGAWSAPLAALVALLVVLAELVPLWVVLGGILDRTEPGDVPGQRT